MTIPSHTCESNSIISLICSSKTYFKDEEYWLWLCNFKVNVHQQYLREVKCFGLFLKELLPAKSPLHLIFQTEIFQTMSHGSKAVSKVMIMCSHLNLIQIQITNRNSQKFSLLSTAHYSGLDRWTYFSPILPITTQIIWIRTTAEPITKTRTSELWSFQTFYKHKSHTSSKTKFAAYE